MIFRHFETGALGFHLERTHVSFWKFRHEEGVFVRFVESGSRIVGKTCRAVRIIRVGGGDVCGLVGSGRLPNAFRCPWIVRGAAILVVISPARVRAFGDMQEALTLAFEVGIVIDRKQVSVFVEGDFLRIAEAACEDFKSRAIRVAAEHRAFMRGKMVRSLL